LLFFKDNFLPVVFIIRLIFFFSSIEAIEQPVNLL
jgi:hypothetical protein